MATADSVAQAETELVNANREKRTPSTELLLPEPEEAAETKLDSFGLDVHHPSEKEEGGEEGRGGEESGDGGSANQIYDYRGRPSSKSKVGAHKSTFFILGMQFASTLGLYGAVTNLVIYLSDKLHETNSSAATNVNNWTGTLYLCSVIGAFIGDAYLGRYLSSVIFLFVYVLGMILSTIAVSVRSLRPPDCIPGSATCMKASTKQAAFFYFSIYVQALGCGAFQPCNTSFGADQFDEDDPKEELQKSKYFTWLYLSSSFGGLIGNSFIVYLEEKRSYSLGYMVSTAALAISFIVYIAGTPLYRYKKLTENPFTRIIQVPVAAIRKYYVQVPTDAQLLYHGEQSQIHALPHTKQFRFLDKAATLTHPEERGRWQLCTVNQVEEVKCLLRLLPMWATGIIFSAVYTQITSLFLEQASVMDTHLGSFTIPSSTLFTIETLSVCIWGLSYETLLVPIMQKFTGNPRGITMLQRMGVGFVFSILAVVVAAVVEIKRLEVIKHHGLENSQQAVPLSVFWLVPAFFLIGASEIFTYTGQYEFFYIQVPDGLRGVGSSLQLSSLAFGSFLSSALISIVTSITKKGDNPGWISDNLNTGHLDYFYWLLTVLGVLNFFVYLICAHWYKYKTFGEKATN